MSMRPVQLLERLLITAGIVLIGFWGGIRLHGACSERAEVRRFEEAREARRNSPPGVTPAAALAPPTPAPPDTRLWSPKRIQAYRESLVKEVAPPLALLRIPSIGLEVPVLEGTDDFALNRGAGRIEGTALPGEPGNVGIAGHRDGFFRGLKDVGPGDVVELETLGGSRAYRVADIRIVKPEDVSVLDPTAEPTLTLVTCYPFYFVGDAPERYIVRAVSAPTPVPAPR